MKKIFLLIIFLPFFITPLCAQDNEETPNFDLKQYFFVMLTKGENSGKIDSAKSGQLIIDHLNNIKKMQSDGKLDIVGPFGDDGEWRGLFIFNVPEKKDVLELLTNDPAIQAGMFKYEIHPWWSEKGQSLK